MDLSNPGIVYILLVIPSLFALAILGQGLYKMNRQEDGANASILIGIFCLVMVAGTYFFIIQ